MKRQVYATTSLGLSTAEPRLDAAKRVILTTAPRSPDCGTHECACQSKACAGARPDCDRGAPAFAEGTRPRIDTLKTRVELPCNSDVPYTCSEHKKHEQVRRRCSWGLTARCTAPCRARRYIQHAQIQSARYAELDCRKDVRVSIRRHVLASTPFKSGWGCRATRHVRFALLCLFSLGFCRFIFSMHVSVRFMKKHCKN